MKNGGLSQNPLKREKNLYPPKRSKSNSREVDKLITTKSGYKDYIQREGNSKPTQNVRPATYL